MTGIVVVGSINTDLTCHLQRWPEIGETVTAQSTQVGLGGKGANQAVAAARLGSSVSMIGVVGTDTFGEDLIRRLEQADIKLALERRADQATGMAFIDIGPQGENIIRLAPGANGTLTAACILRHASTIAAAKVLLLQNEIPLNASAQAAEIARSNNVTVIMDPAPAPTPMWPRATLSQFDIITPNAHETALITGHLPQTLGEAEVAADALATMGPRGAIVTMGSLGVAWRIGTSHGHLTAPKVKTIDTVAAGDCFNGALAVALSQGKPPEEAIGFAVVAAALTTTRRGAAEAVPSLEDVCAFRSGQSIDALATG